LWMLDVSIRCICPKSIDFFPKKKTLFYIINLIEMFSQGPCVRQRRQLQFFVSRFGQFGSWISFFWSRKYAHSTFHTNRLKVRMDANQKTITIMVYPTSLCMAHTQETGKLSDNPNWLPVDQSTFGEQIMRFSKSVIGKDSNKA
jgi:hypothetical protein